MEKYYNQIKNSPIFYGLSNDELDKILKCFNARIKEYSSEECIIRQGDIISNIYLILEGTVPEKFPPVVLFDRSKQAPKWAQIRLLQIRVPVPGMFWKVPEPR